MVKKDVHACFVCVCTHMYRGYSKCSKMLIFVNLDVGQLEILDTVLATSKVEIVSKLIFFMSGSRSQGEFFPNSYNTISKVTDCCVKCVVEGDRGAASGREEVMVHTSPLGNQRSAAPTPILMPPEGHAG